MFIGGKWGSGKETIKVFDPYNNTLIDEIPVATEKDALLAIASAKKGFETIKRLSVHQRAEILNKTADYIAARKDEFAVTIAREGSKTITEAQKEVNRCINTLKISAEESKRLIGETIAFDSFPGGEN